MKQFYLKMIMLTVLMSMVGTKVMADDVVTTIDGFSYSIDTVKGGVSVLGYVEVPFRKDIVIPQKISYESQEYFVSGIGPNAFKDCVEIESITMSNILTIRENAFQGCTNLKSVTMPKITYIHPYAFDGCASLTSVDIPCVKMIYSGAFRNCKSLTAIKLSEKLQSIGYRAFEGCSSLSSITFPESLEEIGISAFLGCTSLTSITFPKRLATIGNGAFENCENLEKIVYKGCPHEDTAWTKGTNKITEIYYPAFAYENFNSKELLHRSGVTAHPVVFFDSEWITCCSTVDLKIPKVEAYVLYMLDITNNEMKVILRKVEGNVINKKFGYLLKAPHTGIYDAVQTKPTAEFNPASNYGLVGTTEATEIRWDGGGSSFNYNYVFHEENGSISFRSIPWSGATTVLANEAYLHTEVPDIYYYSSELPIWYGDKNLTTGIESVETKTPVVGWYNLNGQRIDRPATSGIYIYKGKKRIIK